MRIKLGSGLIPQNILVILLIILIIFVPSSSARVAIGLPFLLLFPGYSLVLALFPEKSRISGVERIALSLGISTAVVTIIGLIVNYTPFGFTLESTLYSAAGFIFIMSFIAWLRLRKTDESERFTIEFDAGWFTSGSGMDRALSVMLVIAALASIGVMAYVLTTPGEGEKFTEFYILNSEGEAGSYPDELSVGEEASVIIGIANHEQEAAEYRVEIVIDGTKYDERGPLSLDNDEEWQGTVTFSLDTPGDNQEVAFHLYKNGQAETYLSTHLIVDVS